MSEEAGKAIAEALDKGEQVYETTDKDGNKFLQRPVSIEKNPKRKRGRPRKTAGRVKVYNKRRCKVFTSDGFVDAESEGMVLESDLLHPNLAENLIRIK